MASVAYEHVSKRFGQQVALNGLDLRVRHGEFMVLVGASGSGKTTALRLLAGLERPSEGVIRIGDRVVNDVPPARRDVAMVFEVPALFPHLTVYDNLAFGLHVRHVAQPEVERGVRRTGAALGLLGLLQRRPRQLSYGHRHQVALGRAIARPAEVFLLDQPLGGLDGHVRAQARGELRRLHRELGATFVHVTHDQEEAMALADRIAVLRDGELQQVASPRGLYDYPANRYVAGFFGSPPMNFLPVAVSGRWARAGAFQVELPRAPGVESAVLGVRPEALSIAPDEGAGSLEMRVEAVERLGPAQIVHGLVEGNRFAARLAPDLPVGRGAGLRLRLDAGRIHLFDSRTGAALF
jgi:multiple sugar transport system ATP-binding protein